MNLRLVGCLIFGISGANKHEIFKNCFALWNYLCENSPQLQWRNGMSCLVSYLIVINPTHTNSMKDMRTEISMNTSIFHHWFCWVNYHWLLSGLCKFTRAINNVYVIHTKHNVCFKLSFEFTIYYYLLSVSFVHAEQILYLFFSSPHNILFGSGIGNKNQRSQSNRIEGIEVGKKFLNILHKMC